MKQRHEARLQSKSEIMDLNELGMLSYQVYLMKQARHLSSDECEGLIIETALTNTFDEWKQRQQSVFRNRCESMSGGSHVKNEYLLKSSISNINLRIIEFLEQWIKLHETVGAQNEGYGNGKN